ncbi:MAG: hypothetical protein ABIT83_01050 [Massilia sp.]
MSMKHLLPTVVSAVLLTACAANTPAPVAKPASINVVMQEADAALKAGYNDKAFTLFKSAAKDFPADKAPWLRMAQLRFDASNYGEAIVNGLEALERDPDDVVAYSLVAVSGLRVSSRALADLTQKNNLSGSVRSEAQDLAKLLRTSLGEEQLVPAKVVKPRTPTRAATAAPVPKPAAAGGGTFDILK